MAFDRKKLGGNICASAKQSTMFIYASDVDDLATISGVNYFLDVSQGQDKTFFQEDIILISATDGFGVAKVTANTATAALVLSEV